MYFFQETNAKLSKMKLTAKSKVASLTAQLEEARKAAAESLEKVGAMELPNTTGSGGRTLHLNFSERIILMISSKLLFEKIRYFWGGELSYGLPGEIFTSLIRLI